MTRYSFARDLKRRFQVQLGRARVGEIQAFRALAGAFAGMSSRFLVEEYHGNRSQVRFNATSSWRYGAGRCELADLMLVTSRLRPIQEVRLTFIQCKREPLNAYSCTTSDRIFAGNYEQWDLLANRPLITPLGSIRPPANVLADALLPSVGSFIFFRQPVAGGLWNLVYSSAANLRPLEPPKHYGRLKVTSSKIIRRSSGRTECLMAPSIGVWARQVARGRVGTPIEATGSAQGQVAWAVKNWLRVVIQRLATQTATETQRLVAREMLRRLGGAPDDVGGQDSLPAQSVVLLILDGGGVARRLRR